MQRGFFARKNRLRRAWRQQSRLAGAESIHVRVQQGPERKTEADFWSRLRFLSTRGCRSFMRSMRSRLRSARPFERAQEFVGRLVTDDAQYLLAAAVEED